MAWDRVCAPAVRIAVGPRRKGSHRHLPLCRIAPAAEGADGGEPPLYGDDRRFPCRTGFSCTDDSFHSPEKQIVEPESAVPRNPVIRFFYLGSNL